MAKRLIRSTARQYLEGKLQRQELRFEVRFDNLIAQLQQERVIASALHADLQTTYARAVTIHAETQAVYEQAQQECEHLRGVLAVKQRVIEHLLPYYPHPLSPELRQQIALT